MALALLFGIAPDGSLPITAGPVSTRWTGAEPEPTIRSANDRATTSTLESITVSTEGGMLRYPPDK